MVWVFNWSWTAGAVERVLGVIQVDSFSHWEIPGEVLVEGDSFGFLSIEGSALGFHVNVLEGLVTPLEFGF